jgi:nitrate/nitrite-specific signal transduction histidine kinase
MMQLELDEQDAEVLSSALKARLEELNRELSRTEKRAFQHELALFVTRLEAIAHRLDDAADRKTQTLVSE